MIHLKMIQKSYFLQELIQAGKIFGFGGNGEVSWRYQKVL
jgi:hypothetical protein